MITTPGGRPVNIENAYEPAVINSLEDNLGQGRVRISAATLSGVIDPNGLPWARSMSNHSNVTGQQGGTMESAHSFKVGDWVMVYRPTASEQDWVIAGHASTLQSNSDQGAGSAGGGSISGGF